MKSVVLAVLLILGLASPIFATSLSESIVNDIDVFSRLLQEQVELEHENNMIELHLQLNDAHDLSMIEMSAQDDGEEEGGEEGGESKNPSWVLPYPPLLYAHAAHGGFFHPYSNVNPLGAPWGGFAPVAHAPGFAPSAAAVYNAPLTAALHGHALYHGAALGLNSALLPHGAAFHPTNAKGGYNVHGLTPGSPWGYHPGLSKDLDSLGGKKPEDAEEGGEEEAFLEVHDPEAMNAEATDEAYGLFPAPMANSAETYVRSDEYAIGPHSSQLAEVGENEVDGDFPA